MKKFICLLIFSFLVFSCEKKEISNLPFEVTKNISCDDLYDDGYKRIFGVDVDLIGRKYKNIEIVYNKLHYSKFRKVNQNSVDFELDTVLSRKYYEMYKDENWLEVQDSIYYIIWGKKEILRKLDCENSYLYGRGYDITLSEKEIRNIRMTIDVSKFKIFNIYSYNESNFRIENFKVINISRKDTFQCYTYKDKIGKYHFSTSIQYRQYD